MTAKRKLKASARTPRGVDVRRRGASTSQSARVRVSHVVIPGHEVRTAEAQIGERVGDVLIREGWSRRDKIAGRVRWTFRLPTVCVVNGRPLLQRNWLRRRIRAGDVIAFVSRPHGGSGSGKTWLAIGAAIALAVIAPWAGGLAAGALGLTGAALTIGSGLVAGAIAVGGSLLISSLITPKAATQSSPDAIGQVAQLYTVQAQGNTARPLAPIPVQYGRLKIVPDYASAPYSEYEDNDQYLNVLLSRGAGKYDVHQVLTEDTVIWDADDWAETDGVNPAFAGVTLAHYNPGDTVDLFPTNIVSAIEVSGQELPESEDYVGGYIANAAGTQVDRLAVDLVFPSGCFTIDEETGEVGRAAIEVSAQYRPVDAAGAPTGDWASLFNKEYNLKSRKPLRFSLLHTVAEGRYEVRVRRNNGLISNGANAAAWAGLRGYIIDAPQSFPCSVTALRIKANAFTQASARRFGIIQTRILPVWDDGEEQWTEQPTRNPLWAFYDAATSTQYGAKRPPSKVDFQWVVTQAAIAVANGEMFDHQFVSNVSVPEAFDTILKPSLCKHRWSGDILSGVRDEYRAVPRMLLTDREIVRNSFDVDYVLNSDEAADAVIVEYLDQNTWRAAEVQYPPNSESFTATRPVRVRIDGIVVRENGYRFAAYLYLQSIHRRAFITLETEHDGRLLGFGSTVHVQSELPGSYGQAGAVIARDGLVLTADRAIDWSAEGQHYIELRDKRGRFFGPVKCGEGGTADLIEVDSSDLTLVESQLSTTLAAVLQRADGAEDPSFAIGVGTARARNCLVLAGRPSGDRVRLSLVVNSEAAYPGELTGLPAAPALPALRDPVSPVIYQLYARFRQGVAEPILDASWWPAAGAEFYRADVSYDDGESWTPIYEGSEPSLSEVVDRAALRLRVQGVGGSRRGAYSTADVDAPDIAIAPGTVNFHSLIEGLRYQVDRRVSQIQDELDTSNRLLATLIAEQDAANAEDKTRLTTEIIRARGQVMAAYRKDIILSTGPDSALAQAIEEVSAAVDGVEANLKVRFVAGVAPDGALARYDAVASAESASAGLSIVAFDDGEGGAFGHVYVEADKFYITGGDADPTPFFIIDTIEDKVYIDGDIILPGSIKVGALDAATITAINAAFDTATITNLTAANISSFYAMYNNLGYISTTFSLSSSKNVSAGAVGGSDEVLSSPAFTKSFTAPSDGMFLLFNAKAQVAPSGFANRGAKLEALFEVLENGSLIASYSFGPAGSYGADGATVGVEDYQWRFVPVTNGATVVVRLKFRIYRRWYNNPGGSSTSGQWDLTAAAGSCAALALFPNGVS